MTNSEFIKAMRANRGALKTVELEMEAINTIGTSALIEYALTTKQIGVKVLSEIARYPAVKQDEFVVWVNLEHRNKQDIEIKLASL